MHSPRTRILLLASLAASHLVAQVNTCGRIIDRVTGEPLAYAQIGLRNTATYTISGPDGSFTLAVPDSLAKDSLRFSMVGYESLVLAALDRTGTPCADVRMTEQLFALREVEVSAPGWKERELGVRSHHALFNYYAETTRPDEIMEVAQLIDLGRKANIHAVRTYISWAGADSALFRISFRGFDGDRPTERLLAPTLTRKVALKKGWLDLPLDAPLRLSGPVVVSLELLPDRAARSTAIAFGIKLGGGVPGFDRRGAANAWQQPPHRYSIHVLARVPPDDLADEPDDPEPFRRMIDTLFRSTAVNDTFAIAVKVPPDYAPGKAGGYPTIYLLDANFFLFDVADRLGREMEHHRLPPAIIVGIGYKDFVAMDSLRTRDYLFPADTAQGYRGSGGGERFLSFMQDELVPYIDRRYPTDANQRVLAGHSCGGYFPLFSLYRCLASGTCLFNGYVAASPELSFHDRYLLKRFSELGPSERRASPARLYVAYGSREDAEENDAPVVWSTEQLMSDVQQVLGPARRPDVLLRTGRHPRLGHMESAMPSFLEGMKWVLPVD